jgi:hypothetical protein
VREQSQTRKDLEVSARKLVGDTSQLTENAATTLKVAGPAVGVLAVLGAFVWGRRRGRKQRSYVEVRYRK